MGDTFLESLPDPGHELWRYLDQIPNDARLEQRVLLCRVRAASWGGASVTLVISRGRPGPARRGQPPSVPIETMTPVTRSPYAERRGGRWLA
jgi:hypothetical protein